MFRTPLRGVLRDMWRNRARTLLVVCSIAVGVFLLGTVAHMRAVVGPDLERTYAEARPASLTVVTEEGFDEELLDSVRRLPGVAEADARRTFLVRFRARPGAAWQLMDVTAVPDYRDMRVNLVRPEGVFTPRPADWPGGDWPPPEGELVLERTSLLVGYLGLEAARQGDVLELETLAGSTRRMRVAGLAYDFARLPATFAGRAYAYVDIDTLDRLGEPRAFNELHVLAEAAGDPAAIRDLAGEVRDLLERGGHVVERVDLHEPGRLPLHSYFEAFTLVLGLLGATALLLSAFPITNTITALLAQQTRQIGVMKAVGARAGQVAAVYLGATLVYGLLAVLLAAPLAARATREFVDFLAYFLNFKLTGFGLPAGVVALEAAVGLLVPLLAGLLPVTRAARMTVREAIASQGIADGAPRAGRALRLPLPRPVLLSLRNTLRRRGRLVLTVLTMSVGSALFIGVVSVRGALFRTYAELTAAARHDVEVIFERPYRTALLEGEARAVPGVAEIESWTAAPVYRVRPDGGEGPLLTLTALPAETALFRPRLVAGRWLRPEDESALVIAAEVLADEPDLAVGSVVTLDMGAREVRWQVVGVVQGALSQRAVFANQPYAARQIGEVGRARSMRLRVAGGAAEQERVAEALQRRFDERGLRVAAAITRAEQDEQSATLFNIIISFLLAAAALVALVGGLSLMGTMSLNVIERTREIGVMRAIGASEGAVRRVVVAEGLAVGLLSWAIGAALAVPLAGVLAAGVGLAFLQVPLAYSYSLGGALGWLAASLLIAAAASLLPARSAGRVTVREALAYE